MGVSHSLLDLHDELLVELFSRAALPDLVCLLQTCKACRQLVDLAAARIAKLWYHRPLPAQSALCWGPTGETSIHRLHYLVALLARERTTIAGGVCHTVCMRPGDGRVFACGCGEEVQERDHAELHAAVVAASQAADAEEEQCCLAQLGLGSLIGPPVLEAQPLVGLAGVTIVEVAASSNHTLLLGACGGVWTCGIRFEVLDRSNDDRVITTSMESACGHDVPSELTVPRRVETFYQESCAAWPWGAAQIAHHQVRICRIATADDHSLLVSDEGTLYSCGAGEYGQLGHGDFAPFKRIPTAVDFVRHIAMDSTPFAQRGITSPTVHSVYGYRPCQVSACLGASLAVTHNGVLCSWGVANAARGLGPSHLGSGRPFFENVGVPTRVTMPGGVRVRQALAANNRTLAVTTDGSLYTFGNHPNRLGHGETTFGPVGASDPSAFVPRLVAALAGKRVRAVQAGHGHNVVLTEAGEVFTFGDGGDLQLGLSDDGDHGFVPAAVTALAGMQVEEVAAGHAHTIVRLASGELRSFGSNSWGQLGHSEDASFGGCVATPGVVVLPAQAPPE
jgi:alpha-tubulin suppressor-like RCC1 family protein